MTKILMIYGATGYTGRMVAAHAVALGVNILLAGRNATALRALAAELDVPYRLFTLESEQHIDSALVGVTAVLNCAGPFQHTAPILMPAAIRNQVHYLDVAAELDGYLLAETLDNEAEAAGVMLLPGSGGSVAMLGTLAAHAVALLAQPKSVQLALRVNGPMSRGSAITAMENVSPHHLVRRNNLLIEQEDPSLQAFQFVQGSLSCFPVTLPDVVTIGRSTGIANIDTYVHVAGDSFPQGNLADLPDGPTYEERASHRYEAAIVVVDENGTRVNLLLDTVNGYSFTAEAAAEAGRRVVNGEFRAGFHSPVDVFGADFALTIADTRITRC